jgi:hypothetical protein
MLDALEGYKEIAIVIGTIVTYILGVIFHRITRIVTYQKFTHIVSLIGIKYPSQQKLDFENYAYIYQYGSASVLERVSYNESLMRLYRGTIIIPPLIGILTWIWFNKSGLFSQGLFVFIVCMLLSIASFVAHKIQMTDLYKFIDSVCREIKKTEKRADS